jgi:MFS family permease
MTNRGFYGWKLLMVFWIVVFINLAFPIFGSSVLNSVMMRDLNLDRKTLGFLFSLFSLMSGLPGPLVAVCVERFGIRITLVLGSLSVAAGSLLMATVVRSGLHAAIAFGVFVGVGVAMGGVISTQAGLTKWFVRRRALVLAILSTASGVGGFIAAPLLNRVVEFTHGNWRMGWWLIAILSCCAVVLALLFVKEKPSDLGQEPDGGTVKTQQHVKHGAVYITTESWSYREVITGPFFWLMMFCQMSISCGNYVFMAHGVVHLQDLGHTRDTASWAISLMALAGLGAKAIVGAFGDRIDPRYIWAAFMAIFGLGQFYVLQADTYPLLVIASSCMGIGFGGGVVCLATVLGNYYGMKTFAALIGLTVAINTSLSAIAPSLAGWLYDKGFGYQGVFYSIGIWCIVGSVILFIMKPPVRKTSLEPVSV